MKDHVQILNSSEYKILNFNLIKQINCLVR